MNEDNVNHPKHYTFGKFEVIDVLQDWFADKPLLWQVAKYIARAKHKGNYTEDLEKAKFYLDVEINNSKGDIDKVDCIFCNQPKYCNKAKLANSNSTWHTNCYFSYQKGLADRLVSLNCDNCGGLFLDGQAAYFNMHKKLIHAEEDCIKDDQ